MKLPSSMSLPGQVSAAMLVVMMGSIIWFAATKDLRLVGVCLVAAFIGVTALRIESLLIIRDVLKMKHVVQGLKTDALGSVAVLQRERDDALKLLRIRTAMLESAERELEEIDEATKFGPRALKKPDHRS